MSKILAPILALIATALASQSGAAAGGEALEARLDKALESPALKKAKVGVHIVEVATGDVVYERNAAMPLNPASAVKLVTTAAALDLMGPDHRFVTRALGSRPEGGVVHGDIILEGGGDPALMSDDLWRLAHLVSATGVTTVTGGVRVDHSRFDGDHTPPHFNTKKSDHAYRAQVCAAAIDYATLQVRVHPGDKAGQPARVQVDPPGAPAKLDSKVMTKAGKSRLMVSSVSVGGVDRVTARGSVPPGTRLRTVLRRTAHPAKVAGSAFKAMLAKEGVTVAGDVTVGPAPAGVRVLAIHRSRALGHIVGDLNKWSNNFMAEMLLKGLAAHPKASGASSAAGIKRVSAFLTKLGVPADQHTLSNGSGLYDANRISAQALTTVLVAMHRRPDQAPEFVSALAVGGREGTLHARLKEPGLRGRVRAKTGTLARTASLAGYVRSVGGRTYAFAFMGNDVGGVSATRSAADRMARVLASIRGPEPPSAAAGASAARPATLP